MWCPVSLCIFVGFFGVAPQQQNFRTAQKFIALQKYV